MMRVGDVLLGVGGDALGAALVVEDDRAVLLDLVLLGDRRLLVGIDVLGRDLLRRVLVFLQLVAEAREARVSCANTMTCSGASSFASTLRSGPTG